MSSYIVAGGYHGMGQGFMSWLRSNEDEIIGSLELQAEILVKSVSTVIELMNDYSKLYELGTKIEDLEHEGDKITHNIYVLIDKTFVTPLDKEDISNLAGQVDQIIDYTDRFVGTLVLFEIEGPSVYMSELAKMLLSSCQEIYYLVKKLRGFKNSEELIRHCQNISQYEHEADVIFRTAIADLFKTNDAVHIIKMKEVYEILEGAHDRCADVADVFEDIALKYG
jgi:predicted phosphate transport protein (TIGR00153 family)